MENDYIGMKNALDKFTDHIRSSEVQDAKRDKDFDFLKITIARIEAILSKDVVSRAEFEPVKNLVYGLVGLILVAVIGAIMTLLLKQ